QNGSDVIALFAVYQTNPQGIMVHADRKMKMIGDVFQQSGTLAMQSGLPYAEFLRKKYPNSKVKIVPYAGGISSFLADPQFSQQCFVTSEPLAAKKAGKNPQTFLIAEAGYNPYTTVVVTRESFWKSNPGIVKKLTQAVRQGWQSYLHNPDKTNLKMQALNPSMDLETFKDSAEAQLKLIKTAKGETLGEMTEARWQELINQLLDLKVLKKEVSAKSVFIPFTKGE
ncbi:MAG: ABC transporter substrate-binding protein, partial [Pseudobdellovibrionaceae bacterium]